MASGGRGFLARLWLLDGTGLVLLSVFVLDRVYYILYILRTYAFCLSIVLIYLTGPRCIKIEIGI